MTKLTINSVQRDFKIWRTSRLKKGRIPDHLWDKASKLLEYYSAGEVARALQLSGSQIVARRKQLETNSTALPVTCPINFLELNMPPAIPCSTPITNSCSRLEIKRPDGAVLTLEQLSEQTMLQLFNQFTRGIQ